MLPAQECVLTFYALCVKCVAFTWKLTRARLYQEAMQSKNRAHWASVGRLLGRCFAETEQEALRVSCLAWGSAAFRPVMRTPFAVTLCGTYQWGPGLLTTGQEAKGESHRAPLRVLSPFSRVQLFATVRTSAHRAPLSMGAPGKNTGEGCQALPARDLPNSGSKLPNAILIQFFPPNNPSDTVG